MTVEKIIQGLRYTISRFPKVRKQLTIGEEVVVDACEEAIKLLEADKWTPVVSGDPTTLPKPYENVLVQYGSSMYVVYLFIDTSIKHNEDDDDSGWYNEQDEYLCDIYEVEAWRPLPKPYKEVSK